MKPFMTWAVALTLAFTVVVADEPKTNDIRTPAVEQPHVDFSGTWEIASAWPEGITKDARKLLFRKDGTYAALDKENKELWAGTYNLDPTASPKIWDHRSYESLKQGGDALGIYELDGDKLKVACVVGKWVDKKWEGKPRPNQFKLPDADAVLELRRAR